MQNLILCPRCRRQVKADNLGELICPSCNIRVCPKAHAFDGKICPHCGWEDPNYNLWLKEQKAREQKTRESGSPGEQSEIKAQYICPRCGTSVDAILKDCPFCGFLGAKYHASKPAPAARTAPIPTSSAAPVKPILDSIPRKSKDRSFAGPAKSTFVKEVYGAEGRHWHFPSLRKFVRPVLASMFVGIVALGLIFGGISISRLVGKNPEPAVLPPAVAVGPSKTYILTTNTVPAGGGEITIVPSSASGAFEPDSQVTLTAVPGNCYTFRYWDGVPETSETITIAMDSDKNITANFLPKDTTPPIISAVNADCDSDISATISWETDKPATGQLDYGKTKDYGLSAIASEEMTTFHNVRMTGLEPNTTYYVRVKSTDECGNEDTATKMITTAREITYGERVGQRALDFTLPYYHDDNPASPNKGGTETLSTYLGKKKIMLNFWSTYCGACIGEFAFMRGIYENENFADKNSADSDYVIFTICIDSKIDEAPGRLKILESKFGEEAGPFTFPMLMDTVGQTKKDYHIFTIPETVFIDSDGIIRDIKIGRLQNIEEIETILTSLN
jgi:thiol-disulfide isomerase/thioredoxin/predicted  nucleic acid-binding Zn-ribbon protein